MANPANASETGGWHGRLADEVVTGLARSFAVGISPLCFFPVWKKCIRCFCCCMMSCHETICKIKQHDIRIEFHFFHNKQNHTKIIFPSICHGEISYVCCALRVSIGSGTCWSQQKKNAKWCNWRHLHSQLHMDPMRTKISPTKSCLKMFFLFSR